MKNNVKEDLETLAEGKPYIRGIVALALYLRFGGARSIEECYAHADKFIRQLESDIKLKATE
jgi:hypothetical protein